MTKDLTELKDYAFYYTNDGIEQAHYCEVNGVKELVMPELDEVLAPVPSYEEWKNITNTLDYEYKGNLTLREENAKLNERIEKLEEFLKECKQIIEWYKADYKDADVLNEDVITKIDNAIGEKK